MRAHSCVIVSYANLVPVRDHVSSLEPAFLGATPHADADQSGHHLLLDFCISQALRYMLAASIMF